MARIKALNVGNTDRNYNCYIAHVDEIDDFVKVNTLNEEEIEKEMDFLKSKSKRIPLRDSNNYLVYHDKYKNDTLIHKIVKHGGGIRYYTHSIVPYHVVKELAMNLNSEAIYMLKPRYTEREQENVALTFMSTKVIIDAPIIMGKIDPYEVLFSLHDLKTDVDDVQFSFPPLHEQEMTDKTKKFYTKKEDGLYHPIGEYVFDYFKEVQNSLSIWAMNIKLILHTDETLLEVDTCIEKDLDKRNPNRKKSGKVGGIK